MVKSVKAIILVSVMVSMSVMLINSCGVSSPTASTGNTGVSGPLAAQITPAALTLNPASKSPLPPVLADPAILTLSPASMADILKEPHANPNASGTPVPYSSICGVYGMWYSYSYHNPNSWYFMTSVGERSYTWVDLWCRIDYPNGNFKSWIVKDIHVLLHPPLPAGSRWFISCSLFPPDFMLPDDFFTGSGFPDGTYIIGGMMYEKGTDPVTGNPTVNPPVPAPVDPVTGKPYPDDYYPPAGGTNPPATQPPGNNQPSTGGTNPPPTGGATMVSLTIYTTTPTVSAGTKAQFNVIGVMSDGTTDPTVTNTTVTWNSDNTPVATLNGSGLATTLIEGTANITATYNNLTSNPIPLTVTAPELTTIDITPASTTIYIHSQPNTVTYSATGRFSNTITRPLTLADMLSWSSTPNTIASIDNTGLATAISPGKAIVSTASDAVTSNYANLKVACWSHRYWQQNDARWSDVLYANYKARQYYMYSIGTREVWYGTIGGTGCLMTDISMIILTTGTWSQPDNLNSDMKINGYYTNNDVNPETLADYSNGIIKSSYYASKFGVDIRAALDNCDFVIVAIPPSGGGTGSHWVVVTGYEEGTNIYYILNPANNTKTKITFDTIQSGASSILIGSIHNSVI